MVSKDKLLSNITPKSFTESSLSNVYYFHELYGTEYRSSSCP